MGTANTVEFGKTRMPTEVATPNDILKVLKRVTEMPTGDDAIVDDVVQLTSRQTGYKYGHFYQYKKVGSVYSWVDVSISNLEGFVPGSGEITFDTSDDQSRFKLKWADATGIASCPWVKSEIVMCDEDESARLGEVVLFTSSTKDAYKETAYELTTAITVEEFASKTFYLRSWFKDGSCDEVLFTNNGIIENS